VIAVSDFSREQVVDAYGLDPSRVVTVYSGVESRFLEVPPRSEPAPERPRLLFAGAPIGRKNIDVVLRAMAAAQRGSALSAAVLEIAGAQRHDFPRASALVDQLGLSERVTWLGVVPEEGLPAAFATADVLVYPSLYEGFGFPPLEAMATGTAVVAARAGSLPEVLGDAALLADPTSAEEWRESLEAVLGDRELRRRLERAGTERARRFTWQACAEKTLAVYREAVAESGIAAAR
jgi:glycosyltransferase involved in cell wall biosynthesis